MKTIGLIIESPKAEKQENDVKCAPAVEPKEVKTADGYVVKQTQSVYKTKRTKK